MIPNKTPPAARVVFQAVEIRVATLWDRFQERDQELEVTSESNAFVKICPWLQADCCGEEGAREEIDECECGDYGCDAENSCQYNF